MANAYDIITERIIAKLEAGVCPWRKPWAGTQQIPTNLVSGKPYRGINIWMLHMSGYASPFWLTYKQAAQLGGTVKSGEKGTPVIFWLWNHKPVAPKADETDDAVAQKSAPMVRYYTVFNVEQCAGLPVSPASDTQNPDTHIDAIDNCEAVVKAMQNPPTINHGSGIACYRPSSDVISMPDRAKFTSAEEYYSTLFHELTHSTGHASRLNRKTLTDICPFGSTNYSKEELVAEMGAAYLCGITGIADRTIDNSAAYLHGWLQKLKADNRLIIQAAAQAQKAADLILGCSYKAEE